MSILKKAIYAGIIGLLSLFIYTTNVNASTVKVTTDTLNLRKEASTDSDILTLLSMGDECELIEKAGDWYKVKFDTYTGYVAKEYVKEETTSENNESNNKETEQNTDKDSNEDNKEKENTSQEENNNPSQSIEVQGKISKKTDVKILPLIYSSNIHSLDKDATVTIITEMSGWSYIQTDIIEGWIRSDAITGKENVSNKVDNNVTTNKAEEVTGNKEEENKDEETDKKQEENISQEYKEKVMYVNDSYVNIRKQASTSSEVIMVVELNTKLTVIGESGDWYKVNTSSGEAYVSKELLSDEKITTSRSGEIRTDVNQDKETSTAKTEEKEVTTAEEKKETTMTTTSSTSQKGEEIVNYAKQFLGVPYVYGGASTSGFDCSGFTMYVYQKFGISMRHGAQAQAKLGTAINADKNSEASLKQNLQPGDLVFFLDYETMDEIGHCGIYIGDGNFIHASSGTGYCVKINSLLPGEYYNTRYCAARRII